MSSPRQPAVSVRPVTFMVEVLRGLDLDVEGMLARAKIDPAALLDPEGRIAVDAEAKLWELAERESGDPLIGLKVAERLKPGALGSLEYLLRHSETAAQMLARAERFVRLVDDLGQVALRVDGEVATVRVGRVDNSQPVAAGIECLFAVAVGACRQAFPHVRPLEITFSHKARAAVALYREHFECPVVFSAEANEIRFPARALHQPSAIGDAGLSQVLEAHTQHLLSQLPQSDRFVDRAGHELGKLLGAGLASPEALARALHVSERTLRRRLQADESSYQSLLDARRKALALEMVTRDDRSFEQMAETLGFADASTLYRAFKRWTGLTPAQYRSRESNGD